MSLREGAMAVGYSAAYGIVIISLLIFLFIAAIFLLSFLIRVRLQAKVKSDCPNGPVSGSASIGLRFLSYSLYGRSFDTPPEKEKNAARKDPPAGRKTGKAGTAAEETSGTSGPEPETCAGAAAGARRTGSDRIGFYADDTEQFLRDTLTAFGKIRRPAARLASSFLRAAAVGRLSASVEYGFEDPFSTAMTAGLFHMLKGGSLSYLSEKSQTLRRRRARRNAAVLFRSISDHVVFTPHTDEKYLLADAEIDILVRPAELYGPLIRFSLNRDVRWVLINYLCVYFVRPADSKASESENGSVV